MSESNKIFIVSLDGEVDWLYFESVHHIVGHQECPAYDFMSFYLYEKILALKLFALCRRETLHCVFELCLENDFSIIDYLANLDGRNGILLFWVIFLKIRRGILLRRFVCNFQ